MIRFAPRMSAAPWQHALDNTVISWVQTVLIVADIRDRRPVQQINGVTTPVRSARIPVPLGARACATTDGHRRSTGYREAPSARAADARRGASAGPAR